MYVIKNLTFWRIYTEGGVSTAFADAGCEEVDKSRRCVLCVFLYLLDCTQYLCWAFPLWYVHQPTYPKYLRHFVRGKVCQIHERVHGPGLCVKGNACEMLLLVPGTLWLFILYYIIYIRVYYDCTALHGVDRQFLPHSHFLWLNFENLSATTLHDPATLESASYIIITLHDVKYVCKRLRMLQPCLFLRYDCILVPYYLRCCRAGVGF